MNRLVIATHNRAKAGEMVAILSARFPSLEILTLADFPGAPEPAETGATYAENAAIKARSASKFTGEWSLADDAGLEIAALPGELGVWSKRFGGEATSFPEKIEIILSRLRDIHDADRNARFQCSVALCSPDQMVEGFESVCEGRIARKPSGRGGFGYDPIFFLPDRGCTMAELTPHQKNQISHRGKVLRQVAERLNQMVENPSG